MDSENGEKKRPLRVISYSGYRGEETPRELVIGEKTVAVRNLIEAWVEEGLIPSGRKRFFRVMGEDGLLYLIYYDEDSGGWFLERIAVA